MFLLKHYRRLSLFNDLLYRSPAIDLKKLRTACFEMGIPDDYNYRSLAWKLLLGYIGTDREQWSETLTQKRKLYENFINELILTDPLQHQTDDHPLNPAPTSQWNVYFKDNEILNQIFKDVRRLYPDISFFQQKIPKIWSSKHGSNTSGDKTSELNEDQDSNHSNNSNSSNHRVPKKSSNCDIIGRPSLSSAHSVDVLRSTFGGVVTKDSHGSLSSSKSFDDDDSPDDSDSIFSSLEAQEYHWQVVARILFIYAKLNPGQGYVQGMNEIIGPLYYVFSNDTKNELFIGHSEADTFWCFTELMSEIRDMYNSQLDSDRSTGVVAMMTKLTNLLASEDSELYHRLLHLQGIRPHYFAFRWITLLLSQEFPLPEVLRIWDFLFSDNERFNFLICFCCSMLMLLKPELMAGDFSSNMKLLQNFPERIDVNSITRKAKSLMNTFTAKTVQYIPA